jgi:hypothetical protein
LTSQELWFRVLPFPLYCWSIFGQDLRVDFCDVIVRPKEFDNKKIVVRATYRYGFEWQEIYSLPCRNNVKVWLSLAADLPRPLQKALRRVPKNQGTVNATFTGLFHANGSAFGDGSYQYQLDLERLENIRIVSKSGAVPAALTPKERLKVIKGHGDGALR